ncbi:hypothetical protein PENSOL_c001G03650 [Penicillium solitum]|uniref:F-box domain-containing protein n=1 Tax=Penicillium solitum TaxID=60172 RepID=A0A1V6RNM5_9EURO|nr:uncharacterized protein PENSOL_c001G03650 [Penicillium solitum]OQE03395.1 hypothetical protein PENSOL_c001G03650 [Penicillium solitum]
MSLSNPAPSESKPIATIKAACRVFGYLHANPPRPLKIWPDELELIYFIVMNHSEPGQTITTSSSSGVSISIPQNLSPTQFPFPKTWLTHKGRAQRAAKVFLIDAKRIFLMTDAFQDWKRQLFTTSILDLPNELLQLIAARLPAKSLARLSQLNRRLFDVIGFELWSLDRTLGALTWSLSHYQLTVYEKAVEELSKIPESMVNESAWKLFPLIDTKNIHMLEGMALKKGFIGKLYREFLMDTLSHNLERSNPTHLSVEEVLKLGADPNSLSDDTYLYEFELEHIPMLFIAICGSYHRCADFLEHEDCWHEYYLSLNPTGSVDKVRSFLKYGADPNTHISDKTSALHVAVSLCKSWGKSQIVKELIEYGANANGIGPQGKTPLHLAVSRNNCFNFHDLCKDTINALLQAPGIDLDPRDENGRTPLSIAAGLNSAVSVWFVDRMLKKPNVDINSQDIHGKTVLYHSVESGNIKTTKLLLSRRGIDPNLNTKYLPLFFAVSNGMTTIVESLLSKKATDPNWKDSNGRLALTLPTSKNIIKLLIEAGAELDIRDSAGLTARETISQAGINIEQLMRSSRKRKRQI